MKLNEKPVILVDCDGVLADLSLLVDSLNRVLKTCHKIDKCDKYHLHEIWDTTPECMEKALEEVDSFFSYEQAKPIDFSREAISLLSTFFEFKILTARRPKYEKATKNWVKKYFGDLEIIFARAKANKHGNNASISKIDICENEKAFALIEDNPHELKELIKVPRTTRAICIKYPFNEELKNNKKIFRGSWEDITEYLLFERAKELSQKN
jgi:5'(3')-deoxyribonucleotidase